MAHKNELSPPADQPNTPERFLSNLNMRPHELLMGTTGSQGDSWPPTPDFPVGFLSTAVTKQNRGHLTVCDRQYMIPMTVEWCCGVNGF